MAARRSSSLPGEAVSPEREAQARRRAPAHGRGAGPARGASRPPSRRTSGNPVHHGAGQRAKEAFRAIASASNASGLTVSASPAARATASQISIAASSSIDGAVPGGACEVDASSTDAVEDGSSAAESKGNPSEEGSCAAVKRYAPTYRGGQGPSGVQRRADHQARAEVADKGQASGECAVECVDGQADCTRPRKRAREARPEQGGAPRRPESRSGPRSRRRCKGSC